MPKKCTIEGCNNPLFNSKYGRCKYHMAEIYAQRAKAKKDGIVQTKTVKSKPLSRKPTTRHIQTMTLENAFALKKWKSRFKDFGDYEACVCQSCGVHIHKYSKANTAHIVSKGALPEARNDLDNMVVVCFNCHQKMDFQKDGQTRSDLGDFGRFLEDRAVEIKNKYKI